MKRLTSSYFSKGRLLGAALAVALGVGSVPFAIAAGPSTTKLDVDVSGSFDGVARSGSVAGVTFPTAATGVTPETTQFTFALTCSGAGNLSCDAASGPDVVWDFGDGSSAKGNGAAGLTTTHAYTSPGVYTVRAKVAKGNTQQGEGTITALVSPRWADADVNQAGKPGRPDRAALWAASALDLVPTCRQAFALLDPAISSSSTDVGRGLFCPEPSATYSPPNPGLLLTQSANGITGVNCLTSWDACGLPVEQFLRATTNPRGSCVGECISGLQGLGKINATNVLYYDPLNCLDNFTAVRSNGAWSITTGVEPGCVSRNEFYTALTNVLDGKARSQDSLARANVNTCGDYLQPNANISRGVLRALVLLPQATILRNRAGIDYCDATAAITKAEAYAAVQAASGLTLPASCAGAAKDLVDVTLGGGTATNHPLCRQVQAVLNAGKPLVGETNCPVGAAPCFRPYSPLMRSGESILIGSMIVTSPIIPSTLQLRVSADSNTQPAGKPFRLTFKANVPRYIGPGLSVVFTFPATGGTTKTCPATTTLAYGSTYEVTTNCAYTLTASTTTTIPFSAQLFNGGTPLGAAVSSPLTLTAAPNRGPLLGNEIVSAINEPLDTAATVNPSVKVSAFDPDGNPLTYTVRSLCDNLHGTAGCSDANSYTQLGTSATTAWGASANTSVGTVNVGTSGDGFVTLNVNVLGTTAPAGGASSDTYGNYGFALKACDTENVCAERAFTSSITARNDDPAPAIALITSASPVTNQQFNLPCPDARDAGHTGYVGVAANGSPTAFTYQVNSITSFPSKTTFDYWDGAAWQPYNPTTSRTAVNGLMRVSAKVTGNNTATRVNYTCTDTGFGGANRSATLSATLQFN